MRFSTLLLCLPFALTLTAAEPIKTEAKVDPLKPVIITGKVTNATPLVEGPNDANIVIWTSRILKRSHYLKLPFNEELSGKWLDRYLDSLDNQHIYFLQSDVKDFDVYRKNLAERAAELGDSAPARVIFSRFRERLEQQYHYVIDMLQNEQFDFTGPDRFTVNRKTLPRPDDLAAAKQLWRDRLRYEYLQEKLGKEKPAEIVNNLMRRYTRVLRTLNEYDQDDVLEGYLTALTHCFDPHSDYMGKSQLENFSIGMKLSLTGIGALLRSEDGICKIQSLTVGGPAERSKQFKPNDKIIAVAQSNGPPVDVVDMKLNKVVEQIRGPKGTEVRLTVIPAAAADSSERKIVTIIREEIKLEESEAKSKIFEMPLENGKTMRLGVIDLPSFYSGFELSGRKAGPEKSTTTDVAKLLRKLIKENVEGLVLDLRRNGGGSLEEAINLTGLFIPEGPVVQVKEPDGKIFIDKDPDPKLWYDGPLIVLTSRFSASASEILAGALQDYGRALIVGDSSTHGKGTVQSLLQLEPILRGNGLEFTNNPGALKFTIRKFYRASGGSTQLKGVTPDLVLDSVNNSLDVGEGSLENPLAWDQITGAPFEKMNRVESFLSELKKKSSERTSRDRDFTFLRDEIARYEKLKAEKSVSLNEAQRLKEKQENDERTKARKKELAARPESPDKIYEIKLKDVDNPGLPPVWVNTNRLHFAKTNSPAKPAEGIVAKPDEKNPVKPKGFTPPPAGDGTEFAAHAAKGDDDETSDEAVGPVDITLDEARRILLDYVHLTAQAKGVTVTGPGKAN